MDEIRIETNVDPSDLAYDIRSSLSEKSIIDFIVDLDGLMDLGFTVLLRDRLNEIIEEHS